MFCSNVVKVWIDQFEWIRANCGNYYKGNIILCSDCHKKQNERVVQNIIDTIKNFSLKEK